LWGAGGGFVGGVMWGGWVGRGIDRNVHQNNLWAPTVAS
jgi:hypothetical protein